MISPFLDQFFAESFGDLDGLRVRDDGDDGSGFFGVEALEEPLEIGVAAADRGDGIAVAVGTDVDAVECVAVAPFAQFLGVRYLSEIT